ncbi:MULTISPECIES: hypothetical protein [Enterococcus]|uniref:Uncharacterized protein n=1 Tax=Enterococcus thailandicus TaxID=417368 RepID=A0A179EQZ3_ENTTH|nr:MULTISPECIES: hypothetical protein [Enterococcus]ASZ07338.1 hypothetical protein CK496_05235 [Enterococcus thailandicus]MDA3964835.1 hypothetical protein [Enterococcus thailandicus]MDK4351287.1 hypothetical protein [Enterococcus thailandicus]MDT2732979.1 hypothetical protein [Enterococcus thailandicus]MDT2752087.1 hypothetical protein [Enterococcus thailandicus]
MDKKLYYRVMGPTVVLAALVLFIPNFSIRSLVGFLIMFSGLGMYYRLSRKVKVQAIYTKKDQ